MLIVNVLGVGAISVDEDFFFLKYLKIQYNDSTCTSFACLKNKWKKGKPVSVKSINIALTLSKENQYENPTNIYSTSEWVTSECGINKP